MQIPIDTTRAAVPKLNSARFIYESKHVYVGPDDRARLNSVLASLQDMTKLRPSISTVFRLALRELIANIDRGIYTSAALRKRLVEAAGRDIESPRASPTSFGVETKKGTAP